MNRSLVLALVAGLLAGAAPALADESPATVVVAPASATISVGQTVQLTATVLDGEGNPVAANVTWSSTAGIVSADGLFKGTRGGTAVVTATAGNATGSATITVLDTLAVTLAFGQDAYTAGAPVSGTATVVLPDGSIPASTGFTVTFTQFVNGVRVRETYIMGAAGPSGTWTFQVPASWNLVPGEVVAKARAYDGGNRGEATDAYAVTL